MADKNGSSSVLLKIGLPLVLVAAAWWGASYALQSVVTVAPVTVGVAADAVSGSLVVHADGDLKELKTEVGGRVTWSDPLTPDGRFKTGDLLLQLDTGDIDEQIAQARRARGQEVALQRVNFEKLEGWTAIRDQLDVAETALAEKKELEQAITQQRAALDLITDKKSPAWSEAKARLDAAEQTLAGKKGIEQEVARLQQQLDAIVAKSDPDRIAAERALQIANRLDERKEISASDLEQRKTSLAAIETRLRQQSLGVRNAKENFDAQIRALERTKARMSIRAPSDGQVSGTTVFRGALINGGQTVATWFSDARTVVAKVSEEDISRVKLGQSAKVTLLKFPGRTFDAKVDKILTSADPDTQRYTVHLGVTAPLDTLVPFATGEVTVMIDAQPNRLLIPRRALFDDSWVAVVKSGRVDRRKIEVGYRGLNQAEVKSGLAKDEIVIVDQPEVYRQDQRVRVAPSEKTP